MKRSVFCFLGLLTIQVMTLKAEEISVAPASVVAMHAEIFTLKREIVRLFNKHEQVTVAFIEKKLGADYRDARAACDSLLREGVVLKNGHGTATYYTFIGGKTSKEAEEAIAAFVPENKKEAAVIKDTEWIVGARWGKPRTGHPEGAVIFHIQEVLANVDQVSASADERKKLRFIAIVHDTFKYAVDPSKPKSGENHHAMIARRFAKRYTDKQGVLEIIELHDEAYNAWSKGNRYNDWEGANARADQLIKRLGKRLDLYLKFYLCDISTGDKSLEPYLWFEQRVKG